MDITSPAGVALMLKRTPGATTVVSGAVTTYGHFDHEPMDVYSGGEGAGVFSSKPSVVIANGAFSDIGLSPTAIPKGIGKSVTVKGTTWVVADIVEHDPDGDTIRLILANA